MKAFLGAVKNLTLEIGSSEFLVPTLTGDNVNVSVPFDQIEDVPGDSTLLEFKARYSRPTSNLSSRKGVQNKNVNCAVNFSNRVLAPFVLNISSGMAWNSRSFMNRELTNDTNTILPVVTSHDLILTLHATRYPVFWC